MYKVFIENRAVIFTQNSEKILNLPLSDKSKSRTFENWLLPFVLEHNEGENVQIYCKDPDKAIAKFFKDHQHIEAAGGIVRRKKKYLFIKRNGIWDIPKGKMEKNEEITETAVREVEEECGISGVKLIEPITITYHTYEYKGKKVLKKTYWFSMVFSGKKKTSPQLEEGISKVKWLKWKKIDKILLNTYPSIQDVLKAYKKG